MNECPVCHGPLDYRATAGGAAARDENVGCPRCGWERDAGDDPEDLPVLDGTSGAPEE